MTISIAIILSILGQLLLTITHTKEALKTQQGTFFRVKCTVAGLIYLFFAVILTWFFFINPVTP